ncbi:MAG: DNA topoisomerase IV subunit A [Candidatus Bathyarchaeota archaeon]|nr:DNA topoisomerase IV subunit A [Candidatus Bathyarchaeota archaeon]MDH5622956.1 DNA topoisomerase IV subunit A [Candidatus Bathyarchaeota archaeon]MDH5701276.1 DNA topoisomerase IV subunit A [Candidatus Bathyarchaeota archaeon]
MKNREIEISVKERRKEVLRNLRRFGGRLYNQMEKGIFPRIRMPSRSTENIFYSPELRQYILGDKTVRRSARNIRHIRPFTQLVWAGYFASELTKNRKTSTLRDVYYSAQAYDMSFKDQAESNSIVTDLETVMGFSREDFKVFPEERSAIFGDLTIEYTVPGYEGKQLNLMSHPDGVMIGPALTSSEFAQTRADKVIAIEKGGLFTRFIEERVHKKFNALLVLTAGQAPRATRHFIHRLNKELDLPVFIFTDGDPWGMHIAMVIISGSANAAHLRELTTPDAKWSGVWATDIVDYKLPSDPLTEVDIKRLHELEKDPRYEGELWRRETQKFLSIKKKAEQEAFSRYGLTYIVDEYLPAKLEETD